MAMRVVAKPDVLARFQELLGECSNGEIRIPVKISNIAEPERSWEGEFLVDSSEPNSRVPASILSSLGVEAQFDRSVELADASNPRLLIGPVRYELLGGNSWGGVIFSEEGTQPILGFTVLGSLGLLVDRQGKRILPRNALRTDLR